MEVEKENFYGVVREKRAFKWGGFFILDVKGKLYQCVAKGYDLSSTKSESYVCVEGVRQSASVKKVLAVQNEEILVSSIRMITEPTDVPTVNIYEKELHVDQDLGFNIRQFVLRTDKNKAVFKIQSTLLNGFRMFFEENNFTSISTPKIVANGAEGGTNVFKLEYFGKEAYLAQSPQFYKQMMCGVFGYVYETGPVFRAEKHNTSRHVNEYTSLDMEMRLESNMSELIEMEKDLLQYMFSAVEDKNETELAFLEVEIPEWENIENALVITLKNAKDLLDTTGTDLTSEEEVNLCRHAKEKHNTDFVFVTHYPKESRPFYTKGSGEGLTESFDLLYKGMEITSGGQRKESYEEYEKAMTELGMKIEPFESYLNTFKYGMPLHGGFAIGLERLTALLCRIESVKHATLFPRDTERLVP